MDQLKELLPGFEVMRQIDAGDSFDMIAVCGAVDPSAPAGTSYLNAMACPNWKGFPSICGHYGLRYTRFKTCMSKYTMAW